MARLSWFDPFSGKTYHESDRRLFGRGTPPTCPLPPGMGVMAMQPRWTADDGSEEEAGYREFPDEPDADGLRKPPEGYRESSRGREDLAKQNPIVWQEQRVTVSGRVTGIQRTGGVVTGVTLDPTDSEEDV